MHTEYTPKHTQFQGLDVYSPSAEMGILYRNCSNGYFSTLVDGKQWGYPLSQVGEVSDKLRGTDTFVSQNVFRTPIRRFVNLSSLNAIYIDCDLSKCLRHWRNPDELCNAILLALSDESIPAPSYVVASGRGLHLKWVFNRTVPVEAYDRWHRAQREVCAKLKQFGSDACALDGSRLLRACGSLNSRSGTEAKIIFADWLGNDVRRYDFDELLDDIFPISRAELREMKRLRQEKKVGERSTKGNTANLMNPAERSLLVLSDLRKLKELRGWGDDVAVGSRNTWLHVAISAAAWGFGLSNANLEPEALTLASEFCSSLPESEVQTIIRSVQSYGSREDCLPFRTDTIIERLDITDAEQHLLKHLRHSTLRKEVRRAKRKVYDAARRKAQNNRSEFEELARERRLEVVGLRQQGKTYREIAAELGGTVRGVEGLLRQARKKGEYPELSSGIGQDSAGGSISGGVNE